MMQKDSEVFTAHHCLLSPKHNVLFWGLGCSFFSQEGQQEDPQEDPQEDTQEDTQEDPQEFPQEVVKKNPQEDSHSQEVL